MVGRAEVRQVRAVGSHAEKTFTVTLQISHRLVDVHTHFHAFDQSDTPAIKPDYRTREGNAGLFNYRAVLIIGDNEGVPICF